MTKNMKKKRIVLVNFYGTGHHIHYLSAIMSGFDKKGINYIIFGPPSLADSFDPDVYTSIEYLDRLKGEKGIRRQGIMFHACNQIIEQAIKWRATHVHFLYTDWHIAGIAISWLLRNPDLIPVLTVHGASGVGFGQYNWKTRRQFFQRVLFKFFCKKLDVRVHVHHKSLASLLEASEKRKNFFVIPYPIKTIHETTKLDPNILREKLGLSNDNIVLLCYGSTRYDKGADLAVNALHHLPEQYHLLIAGLPSCFSTSYLELSAEKFGVKDRLHIYPQYLSDTEEANFFNICDIVLIPYRKSFFGISGPLMQGASIGKPVFAADIPILADLINTYKMGFTFIAEDEKSMAKVIRAQNGWHPELENTNRFILDYCINSFTESILKTY